MLRNIVKIKGRSQALPVVPVLSKGSRTFQSSALLLKDKKPSSDPTSAEDLASRPDANATTRADYYEYERLVKHSVKDFKATWLNALAERKAQLAQGKVIDSYVYSHIKCTGIIDKTRKDSFAYVVLPFRDDAIVADFYVNAAGRLRMGQLFQDLDSLAGKIAYKHTSPVEPMIVTASVDRIYLLKGLDTIADYNIILSGAVIYTGRSSMEISISARALKSDVPKEITEDKLSDEDIFMTASFTFVARNPETHKSLAINRLLPLNEKEWMDFKRAESRMASKKLKSINMDLERNPPTSQESAILHQLWTASKELASLENRPPNIVFMKDTNVKSTMFMQPQYRNRHSYMIFGGYLMRQTFELAYCCAASFSHALPRFVSLDSLTFNTPVPVGSVLHMDATVVYTEHLHEATSKPKVASITDNSIDGNTVFHFQPTPVNELSLHENDFLSKPGTLIQIKVDTMVQELASEKLQKSGSFIYSFFAPRDMDEQHLGKPGYATVVPESYSEMIEYIQGRRRATETALYAKAIKEKSN